MATTTRPACRWRNGRRAYAISEFSRISFQKPTNLGKLDAFSLNQPPLLFFFFLCGKLVVPPQPADKKADRCSHTTPLTYRVTILSVIQAGAGILYLRVCLFYIHPLRRTRVEQESLDFGRACLFTWLKATASASSQQGEEGHGCLARVLCFCLFHVLTHCTTPPQPDPQTHLYRDSTIPRPLQHQGSPTKAAFPSP